MTFGETVKAAREAKGLMMCELAKKAGISGATVTYIERNAVGTTYEVAEAICKALEISYPLDGFKHRAKYIMLHPPKKADAKNEDTTAENTVKAMKPKRKDTTAQDEAEARLLNISYGTYMAYKETGYLETFKKQQAKDRDAGKNIIESNLIGAGNMGRRRNSLDGEKLS